MLKAIRSITYSLSILAGCTAGEAEIDTSTLAEADPEALFFMMGNGFEHPIVYRSSMDNGNYGACGSRYYFSGSCHTGNDLIYPRGTSVYAIAAGTVIAKSGSQNPNQDCTSGWGYDYGHTNTCNMALAVQHYDDDGSPFVVVYGHLVYSNAINVGSLLSPGQTIGQIARYYHSWGSPISSDHLHFGIYPGTNAPTKWGLVPCNTSQPASATLPNGCSSYGAVAPGDFLNATGREWRSPPFAPTLTSPPQACITGSQSVRLEWVNGSGTYRSHIMICTNAELTQGCINPDGNMVGIEPTAVGERRATSYDVSLNPNTTYYWAVRGIAYNDDGGWGPYSSVRSFTLTR